MATKYAKPALSGRRRRTTLKAKNAIRLIDCDVHHSTEKIDDLYPYLPKQYVEYVKDFGSMMPGVGYTNMPKKGCRAELWEHTEVHPSSNIELAKEHHLDAWDIDIAVLTGSTVYAAAVHPNVDYAAAMCRAFNDWTLETWIKADPRFRASVAIAPSDPKQAAKEIRRIGDHPAVIQVIMPAGSRLPYGNRFYDPIYKSAQKHGLPICIHFGAEGAGFSNAPTAAGYPSYYLEMRMARPQIAMAHVASLIWSPSQWWKQLIFNELWAKKRPDRAAKSSIRRKRALMLALVKYKARPSHEKYCRTKLPASSPNSSHSMQRLHRVSGNNGAD